ncbi:hypothetical protein DN757_18105 [Paenibacillus silvae]|uniref:Uncharacterized protein n=1 Tax=Paenibacillus silvae TaxID=1325358 RepID=A0A2W6NE19_9BACL|nr:hypothetical protein DN757_18105 [Paenibacillus silvae]
MNRGGEYVLIEPRLKPFGINVKLSAQITDIEIFFHTNPPFLNDRAESRVRKGSTKGKHETNRLTLL